MDVNLPGIDGIEAARRLTSAADGPGGRAALDVRRGPVRRRRLRVRRVRRQGRRSARTGCQRPGPLRRRRRVSGAPPAAAGTVTLSRRGLRQRAASGGLDPVGRSRAGRARRPGRRRSAEQPGRRRPAPARWTTDLGRARDRLRRSRSRRPPPPAPGTSARRRTGRRPAVPPGRSRPRNDRSAGSIPDRGELGGEHSAGQVAQRLQSRVDARSTSRLEAVAAGSPLRRPRGPGPARPGSATRCGSTSREIASSRVRRTSSSASTIRARDSASCRVVRSSSATCAGQLGLQGGVAERDRGLVGQRLQQAHVGGPELAGREARPPRCCRG